MFELLGIPGEEERVYLLLAERPGLSRQEIARELATTPRATEAVLRSLDRRNLIWQSTTDAGKPAYSAVSPRVALRTVLLRRQQELADAELVIEQLAERFERQWRGESSELLIEIVKGQDAIGRVFVDLLTTARSEILILERPPYAMSPTGEEAAATQERLKKTGDPPHRVLIDSTAFEVPGRFEVFLRDANDAGELRTLKSVPLKLVIADAQRALIPLSLDPSEIGIAAVVYPSTMLDALVELFELLWTRGMPFPAEKLSSQRRDLDESYARASVTNEAVLSLLAAGLKDESIARTLKVSRRTVDRRIKGLMEEAGISTRFQLGFVASQRKWLQGDAVSLDG